MIEALVYCLCSKIRMKKKNEKIFMYIAWKRNEMIIKKLVGRRRAIEARPERERPPLSPRGSVKDNPLYRCVYIYIYIHTHIICYNNMYVYIYIYIHTYSDIEILRY